MATLTLKNVPGELHDRLRRQARSQRRSLNQEAILCIEKGLSVPELDSARLLAEVRAQRQRLVDLGVEPVTDNWVREAVQAGRR